MAETIQKKKIHRTPEQRVEIKDAEKRTEEQQELIDEADDLLDEIDDLLDINEYLLEDEFLDIPCGCGGY